MPEIGHSASVKFMVSFMLVYDTMSTTNSSPQTTEINASVRAESLMKWVKLGLIQATIIALMAALVDDEKWPILAGAGIADVLLWYQYKHAKEVGIKNPGPSTEKLGGFG